MTQEETVEIPVPLRRGDRVVVALPEHAPVYARVCGRPLRGAYGRDLIPLRVTVDHRLHRRGVVLHAPARSVRRRPAGRHAGLRRPWWRLGVQRAPVG